MFKKFLFSAIAIALTYLVVNYFYVSEPMVIPDSEKTTSVTAQDVAPIDSVDGKLIDDSHETTNDVSAKSNDLFLESDFGSAEYLLAKDLAATRYADRNFSKLDIVRINWTGLNNFVEAVDAGVSGGSMNLDLRDGNSCQLSQLTVRDLPNDKGRQVRGICDGIGRFVASINYKKSLVRITIIPGVDGEKYVFTELNNHYAGLLKIPFSHPTYDGDS